MLRLMLLRHAKSSHSGRGLADRDRPLTAEGRRAALRVGEALGAAGYLPARILCSPARRSRETLRGLLDELLPVLPSRAVIALEPRLYNPDMDCVSLLAELGGTSSPLLVIGHNPGIRDAAQQLVRGNSSSLAQAVGAGFPTAALVVLDCDIGDWGELRPGLAELYDFIVPPR